MNEMTSGFVAEAREALQTLKELAGRAVESYLLVKAAQEQIRAAKERLVYEIEPPLRAQAAEGKNAEERENKFRQLAAMDTAWKEAKGLVSLAEMAATAAEAAQIGAMEESKNTRTRARLLAALLMVDSTKEIEDENDR